MLLTRVILEDGGVDVVGREGRRQQSDSGRHWTATSRGVGLCLILAARVLGDASACQAWFAGGGGQEESSAGCCRVVSASCPILDLFFSLFCSEGLNRLRNLLIV